MFNCFFFTVSYLQHRYKFLSVMMLTAFFIRLWFIFTHLSNAFVTQQYPGLRLCERPLNHTEKPLHSHSVAFVTWKSATLILCGQSRTVEYPIFREISRDIVSIVSIFFVLTRCLHSRIHRKSINRRRATLGSHIWSRRKIFWRHARVSRASFIALAFKSRYNDNYKLNVIQQNDNYSVDPPQQSEDPECQDMDQVYSPDESASNFYSSECTVTLVLLLLPIIVPFGMLGLYNEEKWLGFTLADFEHSSVQEDPTIYANNSLLLGMGPEFSSDIAGDGPGGDREVSDNSSSQEDSDSEITGGSDSSYDPMKDVKLAQKKRKAMLRKKRRRELGQEARRKDLESQKKKREKMGPEVRRSEIEKRRLLEPEARRKEVESQKKKREEMGPEARRSEIEKRMLLGPEARRQEVESRKKK